jgi:transcriptional regulator with XRE-family HTH domain
MPVLIWHPRVRVGNMSESAAKRYADELKAWRALLKVTQQEFAVRIGHSLALVAAVEQCVRAPTPTFARACDAATGAPGTFERWQVQVIQESYPAFFAPVVEFERSAVRIHGWDLGAVPGLLQTAEYARAIVRASRPADSDDAVERTVEARMGRQEILSADHPPMLLYMVHEGVLRHVIGSPDVMAEQLDKLLASAAQPGIMVQVLPFGAHDHAGVEGPIAVYDFESAPAVGYTECHRGGRIVEAQTEVADLMVVLSMLRAAALPVRESTALIRNVRSELR